MERRWLIRRASRTAMALLVILMAACSSAQTQPATFAPSFTPTPLNTPAPTSLPATPIQDTSGLSPDALATLLSVEQVDNYPLYVMQYVGNYDSSPIEADITPQAAFGCSLFAALAENGDKLYGRNFDWEYSPALFLYTDPPDGYASVSMVNLFYMKMDWKLAAALARAPVAMRAELLSAPAFTLDGMNEYGLAIGVALVTDGSLDDPTYDPTLPTISGLGIIRQMLDHARNVDEAVNIFKQYNIDLYGAFPIHFLLADPAGKAVLLEFNKHKLVQLPNKDPWHLATNHQRCIAKGDGNCNRYHLLSERLTTNHGQLDPASAMQLLADVKQSSTQWSVVYNMTTGDINVVMGQNYQTVHTFHLDLHNP